MRARARGKRTRLLIDDDFRQLHDAVASLEAEVERDVKLSKRRKKSSKVHDGIHPPRETRLTKLSIAARPLKLKRPKRHPKQSKARRAATLAPEVSLNVVRVWEPEPPPGEEPVEWVLFSSDPIDTEAQILEIVDRYRARWTIEEYFKALKTGCMYEKRQLEDYESLANLLAVFAPIACTLLHLRSEARRNPDAPANLVLTSSQNRSAAGTWSHTAARSAHAARSAPCRRRARRTHQMERRSGLADPWQRLQRARLADCWLGCCQITAGPRSMMRADSGHCVRARFSHEDQKDRTRKVIPPRKGYPAPRKGYPGKVIPGRIGGGRIGGFAGTGLLETGRIGGGRIGGRAGRIAGGRRDGSAGARA